MANDTPREGRITTDLETIREWADDRDVVPVRMTGEEPMGPEMPEISGESRVGLVPTAEADDYEAIDWETFHDELRESDSAVVEREAGDRERLEVVDYEAAIARMDFDREDFEERLMAGEIVRGEITETTVVETRVVEEAEIESELVGTEVVDEQILDVELVGRACTNCDIVEDEPADPGGMFDEMRYFQSRPGEGEMTGTAAEEPGMEMSKTEPESEMPETEPESEMPEAEPESEMPEAEPYHVELSIEEEWLVTRELIERLTIETRIVDTDVTEFDSIEHADFDVEGLQRTILESGVFEFETDAEEMLAEHEIRTELGEGDAIHTFLDRRRTLEDEVSDHRIARVPVTDFERSEMEVISSMEIESGIVSGEPATGMAGPEAGQPAMDEAGARDVDTTGEIEAGEVQAARSTLTEADEGKAVIDAMGDEVGMVVEVDESAGTAYVDPNPGIAERIMSKLGWGDADEEDYPLPEDEIERVTDDEVHLTRQHTEESTNGD